MTQEMPGDKVALPSSPIGEITVPLMDVALISRIREIFAEHSITHQECGDHWQVQLPDGATKTELWPRVNRARYRIVLPDGYKLFAVEMDNGWYGLRFQSKEFPGRKEQW